MARINLLPWRAERRKQRQKEFNLMLAGSAIAGVLLSFLIISYYNGQIEGQRERIAFVKEQITQVDQQIAEIEKLDEQKARLLARKEVIEQLQSNRSQMVHLFDSLVRTIPDGVMLTAIKQDDQTLTLEGRSQSNARVSTYMRNLESSGWMANPELAIIEARGEDKGLPYEFSLQVKLANPNAPKDLDGDGIPDPVPADEPADAGIAEAGPEAATAAGAASPADAAAPAAETAAPTADETAAEAMPAAETTESSEAGAPAGAQS